MYPTKRERIDPDLLIPSILNGELIEDYTGKDPRGDSCLVLSFILTIAVHSVCTVDELGALIVTAYYPDDDKWENYRIRRR